MILEIKFNLYFMDNIELLKTFNEKVLEIYDYENLIPLRGKDNSYELSNGKQILSWHNEITRHRNCHFAPDFYDYFQNIDDILFISDELVYFTANLYLYKPFINTPLKDAFYTDDGTKIYPLYQNVAGKRYEMFVNVCYEKTYNYWDRIGDLIASFFPNTFTGFVFFAKVLQKLESVYNGNADFDWLLNFSKNDYRKFNDNRIKSVHNVAPNTENKWEQLTENYMDEQKSIDFTNKINSYPDEFKRMNELCKEGFIKTLNFLEFINTTEGYLCKQ